MSQRSCFSPSIVTLGSSDASQRGNSPSPHGWFVRYWRVSSRLSSARSPQVIRR